MSVTIDLTGPCLEPAGGAPARHLVILLHGLGADGNDLIGLAPSWAKLLPDAAFVAPDAPFPCDMAPQGRQWFSLQEFSGPVIAAGARAAAGILDAFIDAERDRRGLTDNAMALVGFSQGCMMALHVALRRTQTCAGVVGYSGMLVDGDTLADELRARPPILLVHGDADAVVPPDCLPHAGKILKTHDIPVTTQLRPGLGHGIDPAGMQLGGSFLRDVLR